MFRAVAGPPRSEADWDCEVLAKGVFSLGCNSNHLPSVTTFLVSGPGLSFLDHLPDFLKKMNLMA